MCSRKAFYKLIVIIISFFNSERCKYRFTGQDRLGTCWSMLLRLVFYIANYFYIKNKFE